MKYSCLYYPGNQMTMWSSVWFGNNGYFLNLCCSDLLFKEVLFTEQYDLRVQSMYQYVLGYLILITKKVFDCGAYFLQMEIEPSLYGDGETKWLISPKIDSDLSVMIW